MQESLGHYYDCCLTLRPAEVGLSLQALPPVRLSRRLAYLQHASSAAAAQRRVRLQHLVVAPTLQDPVVGPSGHIFSREAILENLLAQKKANKRKLKAWEAQQADEQRKVR